MHLHPDCKNSSFYESVQTNPELDLRDNRGKRHNLDIVLLGLIIGILRGRDGNLSSIHRSMVNTHDSLCSFLSIDNQGVISRSQLPVVLSKVNRTILEYLIFTHFGLSLSENEKRWFAGDGKELRGSIEKGAKRGEALVHLVCHTDLQTVAQSFYNGRKQSEKPTLRNLIEEAGLLDQKFSFDALHLNPATLIPIADAGGEFLVGVKENQKELMEDMRHFCAITAPLDQEKTVEKGHGRLEIRNYEAYEVTKQYFDPRWEACHFSTLIQLQRQRTELKTGKTTLEEELFISNSHTKDAKSLFNAVRGHWAVETVNHIRDVTLKEDLFRTKKKENLLPVATLRTLVISLLMRLNPKSYIELIETFQDDFSRLWADLSKIGFL